VAPVAKTPSFPECFDVAASFVFWLSSRCLPPTDSRSLNEKFALLESIRFRTSTSIAFFCGTRFSPSTASFGGQETLKPPETALGKWALRQGWRTIGSVFPCPAKGVFSRKGMCRRGTRFRSPPNAHRALETKTVGCCPFLIVRQKPLASCVKTRIFLFNISLSLLPGRNSVKRFPVTWFLNQSSPPNTFLCAGVSYRHARRTCSFRNRPARFFPSELIPNPRQKLL